MQGGDAFGHVDVELVEVGVVASPGEDFAVRREDNAGDLIDRAGGAMVAGDPLRGGEGCRAGLHGQVDLSVIELAGRVGEVGRDVDGLLAEGWNGQQGRGGKKRRRAKHLLEGVLS